MNFKQWLLNETFKQTPLLKNLHDYLTKQHISDKQFMIEFLNWFDEHKDDLRELVVDWKDAKKPYVLDHETNQEYDPEEAAVKIAKKTERKFNGKAQINYVNPIG